MSIRINSSTEELIAYLLKDYQYADHIKQFLLEEKIDTGAFLSLTDEIHLELGVKYGIRVKILDLVNKCKKRIKRENEQEIPVIGSLWVDRENADFRKYQKIARMFGDDEILNSVFDTLERIRKVNDERNSPMPFVCISNSSGTGKTQLAFSIMEKSTSVFYLLSSPLNDYCQIIYNAFRNPSSLLNACVNQEFLGSRLKKSKKL
jgi:hypothetical protein